MKQFLKNGLLFAVSGLFILTACEDTAEDEIPAGSAPSVTVAVEEPLDAYVPGEIISVVIDFTSDAPIVGATISASTEEFNLTFDDVSGISDGVIDLNAFGVASETSGRISLGALELPEEFANQTLTFVVEIEDNESRLGEGILEIPIGEVVVEEAPLSSFSAILLAAPLGDESSETFFSTNTGDTYSMGQVNGSSQPLSADIDFGYFYGSGSAGTEATIASPADYPFDYGQDAWGTRNSTIIKETTVTESQFNEANLTFIEEAFANGTAGDAEGRVTNLSEGDVLAFETDGSKDTGAKKGLLLVTSITTGDGEAGQIEFSILIEE